jgi:hypothetical protein
MLFLIHYDRAEGRLVSCEQFENSEQVKADDARLELELSLNRQGIEREVVILDAASLEAVRRTHGRYFESLAGLAGRITGVISTGVAQG